MSFILKFFGSPVVRRWYLPCMMVLFLAGFFWQPGMHTRATAKTTQRG